MASNEHLDPTDVRAGDKRDEERRLRAQLLSELEAEDFKWLMADKRGRRIMWRLLGLTGVFQNPFTGNSETFFRCGRQSVGQEYLGDIHEHCPENYEKMVTENRDYANRFHQRQRRT